MTHEALGAAVTLAVCAAVDSAAGSPQPLPSAASLLGSRLRDADQPGTRIHHRVSASSIRHDLGGVHVQTDERSSLAQ